MFCRCQLLGLVLISIGAGLIVGSLVSVCLLLWLVTLALIAVGVCIFRF